MKHIAAIVLFCLSCFAQNATPNLGLNKPSHAFKMWDTRPNGGINANWDKIDTALGLVCYTSLQAGLDAGAKINSCDVTLGGNPGTIAHSGGGALTTQVTVSTGHVLQLGPGTYTNSHSEYVPAFLMADYSTLACTSWQTIIQNSSNAADHENVVVAVLAATVGASPPAADGKLSNNAQVVSNGITIQNCHFADSGLHNNTSLTGTVALTNCHHCKVIKPWFDEIASTHITLVGSSVLGNYGYDDEIDGIVSTGAMDAAVSVINNQKVLIHHGSFSHHGNGAAAFIDFESNRSTDRMEFIDVDDIDMDMSDADNSVFGITLNSAGSNVRQLTFHNIRMHGPEPGIGTNHFISGVAFGLSTEHAAADIEISNLQISYPSSVAIDVAGTDRLRLLDNTVLCPGDSAIALEMYVEDSTIERNIGRAPLNYCNGANTPYRVIEYTSIDERSSTSDRNIFRDNIASRVLTKGASSKIINTTQVDGAGTTYRVPTGFTGIAGGLSVAQLSPPTLSVQGGAVGTCLLSGPTVYFYKVTVVDAAGGETDGSNEVAQTEGAGNGCGIFSWTTVPGAAFYNINRGTVTNQEFFVAQVPGQERAYSDLGGQTPGASINTVNRTGRMSAAFSTPASSSDVCASKQMWYDAGFIYVCAANNTIKRVAVSTF